MEAFKCLSLACCCKRKSTQHNGPEMIKDDDVIAEEVRIAKQFNDNNYGQNDSEM